MAVEHNTIIDGIIPERSAAEPPGFAGRLAYQIDSSGHASLWLSIEDQGNFVWTLIGQRAQTGIGHPQTAGGITPDFVGQLYVDNATGLTYYGIGTSSSADWRPEPAGGGGY